MHECAAFGAVNDDIITRARGYCDPSCLLVVWFVRSLTSVQRLQSLAGGRAINIALALRAPAGDLQPSSVFSVVR